jgi:hypothetical protein
MAEKKTTNNPIEKKTTATVVSNNSIFTKDNYRWMLIGIIVIAIGMFLMSGGASKDPSVFNKDEVYSFRRITLAPILIMAGLVLEIYAIFKRPKPTV